MTRINLLPWRETLRKERKRQFASIAVGAVFLMGAIVFYVHMHVEGMIKYQNDRNAYIQKEIAIVDEKIKEIKALEEKKKDLLNRMNVIQDLQTRRPMSVRLVDELVRVLPEGVFLTSMSQNGLDLVFNGVAQSNARVSAFMRSLDQSSWFVNPKLDVINTKEMSGGRVSNFVLRVKQRTPEDVENLKAGGAS